MRNIPMLIKDDPRPIQQIIAEGTGWRVGVNDVERIVPYEEKGQYAHVTWFEIWINGQVQGRINSAYVIEVAYAATPEAQDAQPLVDGE